MTHRKTLAVILTVAMLLLAGCGGTGSGSGNPVQDDTNATQSNNQTTQPNTSNATTQPIEQSNRTGTDNFSQQQNTDTSMTEDQSDSPNQQQNQNQDNADSGSDTASSGGSDSSDASDSNTSEQTQTANMRVYAEDKADGGYLTGAEVTVMNTETGETYTGTTHSGEQYDGNYVIFEDLPLGTYQLTANAEGYQNATNTVKLTKSGRQPILQMPQAPSERGGTVTLTLVDQDGDPITRGTVSVSLPDSKYSPVDLHPNESGQVSYEAPVDGNYYGISAQGINSDNNNGQINVNGDTQKTIEVSETIYTLTVQADSPVTIERATDGATTTREAMDGTVEFTVLPGSYTISADGYQSQTLDVQDDTSVALESTQPQESNVTVDVNRPNGANLASTITLTGPNGGTYSKETGIDGRATFTVPNGEYEYMIPRTPATK